MTVTRQGAGSIVYGTTSLSFASGDYPASTASGDGLVLLVGMKPSTANSGSVATPTGWTLIGSLTSAGGYSTTLGADTGNTHLYAFQRTAGASNSSFTVTGTTSNALWGQMVRFTKTLPAFMFNIWASASDATAGNVSLAFTVGANWFKAGDAVLVGMCTPTDIGAGAQFSAEALSCTGSTFTVAEISEPFSANGNDIGGLVAGASVNTGPNTGTTATFTATAGGTTTNVRGPGLLIVVHDTTPVLTETLTDDFNDNSRDTTKWTVSATGTTTETNQRLEMVPTSLGNEAGYTSVNQFTFAGSFVLAQVTPQSGGTTTDAGTGVHIINTSTLDSLTISVNKQANTTGWKAVTAAGFTTVFSQTVAYDATNHAWIRARESGGTVYMDVSPDGRTWTNLFSQSTPPGLSAVNLISMSPYAGKVATGTSTGTALLDNFNLPVLARMSDFMPFFL